MKCQSDTNMTEYNLELFKTLLDANKIGNTIVTRDRDDGSSYRYILFNFPVARSYDEIRVYEADDIERLYKSNIMKYRGISNYEAIWSSELKCIECQIQNPNSYLPHRFLLKNIARYFENNIEYSDGQESNEPVNCLLYSSDSFKVSIGYSSQEFALLAGYKEGRRIAIDLERNRYRVTLKVENITVKTEEDARNKLEKISNALFYQIDVFYNFALSLAPRKISRDESLRRSSQQRDKSTMETQDIKFDYEYDKIPMSLYWFAQSNSSSPMFMYFALYQVLEFYYPIYATISIKTKIQNLIKDPLFNVNRDSDVVRLLSIISSNKSSPVGDEKEQLRTTLKNIISGEEIIEFISGQEYLLDYYKSKDAQKLSDKKLRFSDNFGIMDDLTERIYDIRCRIVHNKASETDNKILPMTKEIEFLRFEVEVLKFAARKVIIANSRPFSL